MNPRVERAIGFVLLGAIAIALPMLMFGGRVREGDADDAIESVDTNGRRALWLELSELGFQPVRWDDSPNHLHGHDLLWLANVPTASMPGSRSTDADLKRVGLHALDHYREFVERGGTLMLRGDAAATHFLADDLGFEACRSLVIDGDVTESNAGDCTVHTGADEDLHVGIDGAVFAPLDPNSTARVVWTATCSERTHPFVVEVREGAGSVVLLAQDSFVRNGAIGEHDNAVAAVRLVEQVLGDGRLLLDAYETGSWSPPSLFGLLLSPRFLLATLHVCMFLAMFVWMQAFARAFPRDREALELFSSIARARALGGVLARARRYPALATLMRRGVFAQLSRRIPGYRFVPEVEPSESESGSRSARSDALGSLRRVTTEEVAALAQAAGLRDRTPELEAVFMTKLVRSRRDLDALDRALDRMRADVEDHLRSRSTGRETELARDEQAASDALITKGTG